MFKIIIFSFVSLQCNLLKSSSTGYNLQNLLGHTSLPCPIVHLIQFLTQCSGIVTRSLHTLHPSGQLTCHTLLQCPQNLSIEIQRQDTVDNLKRILLENHIVGEFLGFGRLELLALHAKVSVRGGQLEYLIALLGDFGCREGNQGAHSRGGGDERYELGVHKLYGVGLPRKEGVDDFLRDGEGLLRIGVLTAVIDLANGVVPTLEVARPLLAHEDHVHVDALGFELLGTLLGLLDHEGVVPPAQATIAGNDDECDLVNLALGQKG
eukprot:scaffold29424_cov54-Cyclotella_meneghiniana.AAC.9